MLLGNFAEWDSFAMEVCSSTEMGAPGALHLGAGDHGPKTDRRAAPLDFQELAGASGVARQSLTLELKGSP